MSKEAIAMLVAPVWALVGALVGFAFSYWGLKLDLNLTMRDGA